MCHLLKCNKLVPPERALWLYAQAQLTDVYFRGKGDFFKVNRQALLMSNWGFTCQCEVCAASPHQQATNDALKRNLLAYRAKQEKYQAEAFWGNLYRIFTLEVAMLGLMRKLEAEMIREIPECLLNCYRYLNIILLCSTLHCCNALLPSPCLLLK